MAADFSLETWCKNRVLKVPCPNCKSEKYFDGISCRWCGVDYICYVGHYPRGEAYVDVDGRVVVRGVRGKTCYELHRERTEQWAKERAAADAAASSQ